MRKLLTIAGLALIASSASAVPVTGTWDLFQIQGFTSTPDVYQDVWDGGIAVPVSGDITIVAGVVTALTLSLDADYIINTAEIPADPGPPPSPAVPAGFVTLKQGISWTLNTVTGMFEYSGPARPGAMVDAGGGLFTGAVADCQDSGCGSTVNNLNGLAGSTGWITNNGLYWNGISDTNPVGCPVSNGPLPGVDNQGVDCNYVTIHASFGDFFGTPAGALPGFSADVSDLNAITISTAGAAPFDPNLPFFGSARIGGYTLSVVPVPAAVWLFGSALGLLGWMRRRTVA